MPTNASLNKTSTNPDWAGEDALDLEWARASAPGATVEDTLSPDAGPGLYAAVDWLVSHQAADVISLSWGEPDVGAFNPVITPCSSDCNASSDGSYDILGPVLEFAATEGISVLAASGDCGASGGTAGVSTFFPASDPFVTGVGGTVLTMANGAWSSEVGWSGNSSGGVPPGCQNQGGSGGGYSPFPRPAWQVGLPTKEVYRGVPDVSIDAATPVRIIVGGEVWLVGGTSVGTVLWAGITTLADQYWGKDLGLLNPTLYSILNSSRYSADFHDITSGNNGYAADVGWDPVTGIGTPCVAELVTDLDHGGPVRSYQVLFTEQGLPDGSEWTVEVNGTTLISTDSTLPFWDANGTYGYTVESQNPDYRPIPSTGTFVLNGANLTESVVFNLTAFPVTFVENGLPSLVLSRSGWTVVADGVVDHSTNATIEFHAVPEGILTVLVVGPPGYQAPALPNQNLTGPAHFGLTFLHAKTTSLTFHEQGLPVDQKWCLVLSAFPGPFGYEACSIHRVVVYPDLTPGFDYSFRVVSPLAGQNVSSQVGSGLNFGPNGSTHGKPTVRVTFRYDYIVTFSESGLPVGTDWSITIHGATIHSASSTINLPEPNGTYSYAIGAETGYIHVGEPRVARVEGGPVTVTITFRSRSAQDAWLFGPVARARPDV